MSNHYPDLKVKDLTARIRLYKQDDPSVKTTGAKAVLDQTLFDLEKKLGVRTLGTTQGARSTVSPSLASPGGSSSAASDTGDDESTASGKKKKSELSSLRS